MPDNKNLKVLKAPTLLCTNDVHHDTFIFTELRSVVVNRSKKVQTTDTVDTNRPDVQWTCGVCGCREVMNVPAGNFLHEYRFSYKGDGVYIVAVNEQHAKRQILYSYPPSELAYFDFEYCGIFKRSVSPAFYLRVDECSLEEHLAGSKV